MYAYYGVQYIWVIDPIACTLEAYQLDTAVHSDSDRFGGFVDGLETSDP